MNTMTLIMVGMLMITGALYFSLSALFGFPFGLVGLFAGLTMTGFMLLLMGVIKSPMWTFMSAAYSGMPILRMRLKDGLIDWVKTKNIADGLMETDNHGTFMISPKDPGYLEKKSGAKIYDVAEGLGNTISERVAKTLKYIYTVMDLKTPAEVEYVLKNWHKCRKCAWEGVPKIEDVYDKDEDGEKVLVSKDLICLKCEEKNDLKLEYPQITIPLFETQGIDTPAEMFYPSEMHPFKVQAYTQKMIAANEARKPRDMIKFVGIGMMILLTFVGIVLLLSVLPSFVSQTAGQAAGVVI